MYRYKCFRPNKTYFLNFCQKLSILKLIYEKKQICYFHVGYAIKLYCKNLFNFQLAAKSPKIGQFSKNLTFLKFSDSCLSNYAEKTSVLAILEVSGAIFEKLRKIDPFFEINYFDLPNIIWPYEFWQILIGTTLPISKL